MTKMFPATTSTLVIAGAIASILACGSTSSSSAPSPSAAPTSSSSSSSGSSANPAPSSSSREPAAASDAGGVDCTSDPFAVSTLEAGVGFLASEALGGRVPGTAGDRAAMDFVADRFRCLGLTPGGENGSFDVPFTNQGGIATANIVGILPGSDPDPAVASEIIVIGAHHDHFGLGGGLGLRLGANDNASGVAGLVAVAQAIKQKASKPRRTIAFVAFGSEETLLKTSPFVEGSGAFVAHPPAALPIDHVVYMVNFDMIGSYAEAQKVYALGSMKKTPGADMLAALLPNSGALNVELGDPASAGESDAYPFCIAQIPYVFFWTPDDACYHKSCDTVDKVDFAHLAEIAKLGADLTNALATTNTDLVGFQKTAKVSALGCSDPDDN